MDRFIAPKIFSEGNEIFIIYVCPAAFFSIGSPFCFWASHSMKFAWYIETPWISEVGK
jgi:hypothetical protein